MENLIFELRCLFLAGKISENQYKNYIEAL
jgi:hypothetical protein